jgi:hypothetical protein
LPVAVALEHLLLHPGLTLRAAKIRSSLQTPFFTQSVTITPARLMPGILIVPKRIAILQSNYIPWKGYFDLIRNVDEFVLYDDVQYTRSDWRNRNKIKTPHGVRWLTIPVGIKGKFGQTIEETIISDPGWAAKHWEIIKFSYARSPCFDQFSAAMKDAYLGSADLNLSRVNERFITVICNLLGISSKISRSTDYRKIPGKTERLVSLCQQAGASEYYSGPAGKDYIQPHLFEQAGIQLRFVDYSGYPLYPQLFPPFEHQVSILDLLFNAGADAQQYMKAF